PELLCQELKIVTVGLGVGVAEVMAQLELRGQGVHPSIAHGADTGQPIGRIGPPGATPQRLPAVALFVTNDRVQVDLAAFSVTQYEPGGETGIGLWVVNVAEPGECAFRT